MSLEKQDRTPEEIEFWSRYGLWPKPEQLKKQRGGKREGAGRAGKPQLEKFRHRMITLPPELDNRLIAWSIESKQEISPMLAKLISDFLTQEGA